MKNIYVIILPLLILLLYGGCGSNGSSVDIGGGADNGNNITLDNLCFLLTSDDPCFDTNEGSTI